MDYTHGSISTSPTKAGETTSNVAGIRPEFKEVFVVFGRNKRMQVAVDRYVRAWLCSLTVNKNEVHHLGEFVRVELTNTYVGENKLTIKGDYITSAAFVGLWARSATGNPQMFDKSGTVYLDSSQGVRIYSSLELNQSNKPIPIRTEAV